MIKDIKQGLKKYFLIITGNVKHLKTTVSINKRWYGKTYLGFYACPDFITSDSIVYSFGIGEDISFDRQLINEFGCKVFGFDPTPKSINWVKNQNLPNEFSFHEIGIGTKTEKVNFYLPKNQEHVSGSISTENKNIEASESIKVELQSLKDIVNRLDHSVIDVLKLDIEGAEYEVLEGILSSNLEINQILIEFHDRLFENGKTKTINAVNLLKSKSYELFAASFSFDEISFIHKKLLNNS